MPALPRQATATACSRAEFPETSAAKMSQPRAAEAYTYARPIRYHLDYQTLRARLPELGAQRVVLTHMSADMLARLAEADLPAAYDGMAIDL